MSNYKIFHEYVLSNIKIKNTKLEKYVSKDSVTFPHFTICYLFIQQEKNRIFRKTHSVCRQEGY